METRKKVLIYGMFPDIHTESVAWGLRKKGLHVDVWNQRNFTSKQTISVGFNGARVAPKIAINDFSLTTNCSEYDVIWNRRPTGPLISDLVAQPDHLMAKRESEALLFGVERLLEKNSLTINESHANKRASNKIVQLSIAPTCGFQIPDTLFSNDAEHIRSFCAARQQIVYKPFYQANWTREKVVKSSFTAKITIDDLNNSNSLSSCPGIFQNWIEKDHELRVTIIGKHILCVRIEAKKDSIAAIDWRAGATNGDVLYSAVELPELLESACRLLMSELGLIFGCIDLVCNTKGEYFFLEINPAGQFLWIEDCLPHIPVLDIFCNFLVDCSGEIEKQMFDAKLSMFIKEKPINSMHEQMGNPFRYEDS